MAEEPLNPYEATATPADAESSQDYGFSVNFFVALVLLSMLLLGVFFSRGSFLDLYNDFEVELPQITLWAIHWSLPAFLAIVLLGFVLKEFLPVPAKVKRALNVTVALLTLVLAVIYGWAVFVPLVQLIGRMN